MNNTFLYEVFSSEDFRKDYEIFLKSFDDVIYADNFQKVERFLKYVDDCISRNKIDVKFIKFK